MPKKLTALDEVKLQKTLDSFDFAEMHKVMAFLDWVWVIHGRRNTAVPSVEDLRSEARRLLIEAFKEEDCLSTGGFHAEYDGENFFLFFVVTESDSFLDDDYEEKVEEIELKSKKVAIKNSISSLEVIEDK